MGHRGPGSLGDGTRRVRTDLFAGQDRAERRRSGSSDPESDLGGEQQEVNVRKLVRSRSETCTKSKKAKGMRRRPVTETRNEYGVIGLGRMGGNLARQAMEKGMRVIGFTRHGAPPT